jgi:hypothetical protein
VIGAPEFEISSRACSPADFVRISIQPSAVLCRTALFDQVGCHGPQQLPIAKHPSGPQGQLEPQAVEVGRLGQLPHELAQVDLFPRMIVPVGAREGQERFDEPLAALAGLSHHR